MWPEGRAWLHNGMRRKTHSKQSVEESEALNRAFTGLVIADETPFYLLNWLQLLFQAIFYLFFLRDRPMPTVIRNFKTGRVIHFSVLFHYYIWTWNRLVMGKSMKWLSFVGVWGSVVTELWYRGRLYHSAPVLNIIFCGGALRNRHISLRLW